MFDRDQERSEGFLVLDGWRRLEKAAVMNKKKTILSWDSRRLYTRVGGPRAGASKTETELLLESTTHGTPSLATVLMLVVAAKNAWPFDYSRRY